MKKAIAAILASVMLLGCAEDKHIDGYLHRTYGVFDKDENRKDCVYYTVSGGNIFWSIVFVESIFVPVWLIGFNLYEPEAKIPGCEKKP